MVSSGAVPPPDTAPGTRQPDLDVRGSRRLTGREEWFWYVLAAVSYAACGIWQKFLLNWIIGPLWLVAVVVAGPALWDRVRAPRR